MPGSAPLVGDQPGTRARLVESAAALFKRYGYAATGVKAVLAAAGAPYGSLYHFFPGGKEQLGIAAVAHNGALGRARIDSEFPLGTDVVEAAAAAFVAAAAEVEATGYTDACPIALVALEVASSDEPMRMAAASAFESWLEVLEQRLTAAGIRSDRARDLAVELFCLMEGARLLALTTRSSAPLHIVGRAAADAVAAGLAADRNRSS
jgi:AcrR family transcriptional regulator